MPHHPGCPKYCRTYSCLVACQSTHPPLQSNGVCTPHPSPPQPQHHLTKHYAQAAPRVHFDRLATICTNSINEGDRPNRPSNTYPRSILRPISTPLRPTIYIITFATDIVPNHRRKVTRLLETQLPHRDPPIPHLYTIDAQAMTPPSPRLCAAYSGIASVIQDVVMQDRAARKAVHDAIYELIAFGAREGRKKWDEKARARKEVSMSVCCTAGTHRSVAIGERIAQGIKAEVRRLGVEEGVMIVVRHAHRLKRRDDPF
ncbi:hypothetical protein GQ44DRAFT_733205 [Phaeosphaeriaceae sp. PMI808]|nr:hypothetical protein GQ44DRAFT_733205 [Phaeosphaeriaceae sp. PMI808]